MARTTSVPCGPPSGGRLWLDAGGRHRPFHPHTSQRHIHSTVHILISQLHTHPPTHSPKFWAGTGPQFSPDHTRDPSGPAAHLITSPKHISALTLGAAPNLAVALARPPPPPPGRRGGAAPSWCGLMLGPLWGLGVLNILCTMYDIVRVRCPSVNRGVLNLEEFRTHAKFV